MKEFIDKLIERLEEEAFDCTVAKDYVPQVVELDCIKEIANELAEEYKVSEMQTGSEDCCEWVLIDYEANVYDTTCRNPHILLEGSPTDNSYEFCPYCGKKIKVAPYTEGE